MDTFAKKAFVVQHAAIVTQAGRHLLNEVLGLHGMAPGAIKTFRTGFTQLDAPGQHPATSRGAIGEHPFGRPGMLERWRKRLMTEDARARRDDGGRSGASAA